MGNTNLGLKYNNGKFVVVSDKDKYYLCIYDCKANKIVDRFNPIPKITVYRAQAAGNLFIFGKSIENTNMKYIAISQETMLRAFIVNNAERNKLKAQSNGYIIEPSTRVFEVLKGLLNTNIKRHDFGKTSTNLCILEKHIGIDLIYGYNLSANVINNTFSKYNITYSTDLYKKENLIKTNKKSLSDNTIKEIVHDLADCFIHDQYENDIPAGIKKEVEEYKYSYAGVIQDSIKTQYGVEISMQKLKECLKEEYKRILKDYNAQHSLQENKIKCKFIEKNGKCYFIPKCPHFNKGDNYKNCLKYRASQTKDVPEICLYCDDLSFKEGKWICEDSDLSLKENAKKCVAAQPYWRETI